MTENNNSLFGDLDDFTIWKQEWKDMPEFVQEEIKAFKKITVHFIDDKDVEDFGRLVEHNITSETKGFWYPEISIDTYMDKRWIDEA